MPRSPLATCRIFFKVRTTICHRWQVQALSANFSRNAHSEKFKHDPLSTNRLAVDSDCNAAERNFRMIWTKDATRCTFNAINELNCPRRKDSNLRTAVSISAALPLGFAPTGVDAPVARLDVDAGRSLPGGTRPACQRKPI